MVIQAMAKYTDRQAQDELKRLIDEIDNVRKKPRLSPKFKSWQAETSELLERVFGRSAKQVKEFDRIPYSLAAFSNQTPDSKFDEAFHQGLKSAAIFLSSVIKDIQSNGVEGKARQSSVVEPSPKESTDEDRSAAGNKRPANISSTSTSTSTLTKTPPARDNDIKPVSARRVLSSTDNNAVLLVSSGEKIFSADIESFLSKIGLSPVVVSHSMDQHEQLFSMVEENSDAGYAVVLLGFQSAGNTTDNAFGLGLLAGRLGPEKVCAVVHDKVTGIDTYSGISYVPVDAAGAWKFMMIKNLKAAGFDVDANLAL